jgi:hypothetical protein
MDMLNLQEQYKQYYTASEEPEVVEIDEASYVSILGKGSPGTDAFYEKKYEIKRLVAQLEKRFSETEKAFRNSVVEIFYWYNENETGFINIGEFYSKVSLNLLRYRIVIRVPGYVSEKDIQAAAIESVNRKYANAFEKFTYTSGKSVQLLHVGPLAGELETLPLLEQFASGRGLKKAGMHHEIHLVNFERGENQSHLQTILRDPVTELIN